MTFTPPTESDYSYLDRLDQIRTQARQVSLTAHPGVAINLAHLASTYPGISPGLAYAFAATNQTDPTIVGPAWQQDLATRLDSTPGTTRPDYSQLSRRELISALAENPDKIPQQLERALNTHLQGASDQQIKDLASEAGITGANKYGRTGIQELQAIRDTDPQRYLPKRPDTGVLGLASRAIKPVVDVIGQGVENYDRTNEANPINQVPGVGPVLRGLPSAKEAIRGVATAAQAPYEASSALLRETAMPGNPIDPSTWGQGHDPIGGQSLGSFAEGIASQTVLGQTAMGKTAGSGFLPSPTSPAAQAAAESARKYSPYLIGGHAWTPGRSIAGTVFEPDSDAFNIASGAVDAGVQITTDPTIIGLNQLAEARAAGRAFVTDDFAREASGVFAGVRARFSPKGFTRFQTSQAGADFAARVAAEDSEWVIHHATGIPNRLEDGTPLVSQLAQSKTPEEVWRSIEPHVGISNALRETPTYRQPGYGSRLLTDMPGRTFPVGQNADFNLAAKIADDALVNNKATLADRKEMWKMWATVDPDDKPSIYRGVDQFFTLTRKTLELHGVPPELAAKTATFERDRWIDMANYGHDAVGHQLVNQTLTVAGDTNPLPHPIFDNQFLNSDIRLPDSREIRRMVSSTKEVWTDPRVRALVDTGDLMMTPWRKLMLMRPAWGVRVVGEEQLRMAADGFNSLFSAHPLRAIAYAIGSPESRWVTKMEEMGARASEVGMASNPVDVIAGAAGRALRSAKETIGRGSPSTLTYLEDDPFMQAHYIKGPARWSGIYDETPKTILDQFGLSRTGDPLHPQAIAEELVRMRESKVARAVVDSETPDALKDWFWDGGGSSTRTYMASDPRLASMGGTDASARLVSDAQMDTAAQAVQTATANHPVLTDALRTGEINNIPLIKPGTGQLNTAAVNEISRMIDAGETVPSTIRIRKFLTLDETSQRAFTRRLGHATDYVFNALMPRPSDYLSRSSTFRQAWWDRQIELMPYMDTGTRSELVKELGIANMRNDPIARRVVEIDNRLTALGDAAPEARITSFQTADTIAKQYGLTKVKDLLYDLSTRSQVADMGRLIAPFAEAWREVLTRWMHLAYNDPSVIRKATNAIWQVQQPGSGSINRALGSTSEGGFFHQDQFGQEVFTYPGSELITKSLMGIPVPLTGNVQSLNIIGQGLPGLGPAVSVPLSYLLPDKPSTDWISNQLFPYGRSTGNPLIAVAKEYIPSWAQRAISVGQDPASDRLFANTVFDVARYLNSTGAYDIQGPDAQTEINRLMSDAKSKTRAVYAIRAMGSLTLPASPSPEWLTVDKTGRLTLAWKVADWYNKKVRSTGSTTEAMDAFLRKFGADNLFLTQPKSKAVVPSAPTTDQAGDWYRSHPNLVAKYPIVAGLFAPTAGIFDTATYEAQFARGERKQLTPEEMTRLANARLGNLLYTKAQDNGADANSLRDLRAQLTDEFPGYATGSPISSYARADVISELQRAVKDPAIRKTEAGKALKDYLDTRFDAINQARRMGLVTPWSAAKAYPIRLSLWQHGEALVTQYPSFQPIWDTVFNKEIK